MSTSDNSEQLHAFALQIQAVQGKLESMGNQQAQQVLATNAAIGDMRSDMRSIDAKLESIVSLRHASDENRESIRRLWSGMEARDQAIKVAADSAKRITWVATGMALVLSVFGALLVRTYNNDRTISTDTHREMREIDKLYDDRLDRIELYLAGNRSKPFER